MVDGRAAHRDDDTAAAVRVRQTCRWCASARRAAATAAWKRRTSSASCEQIGSALAGRTDYHVVAVRSTLLPGVLDVAPDSAARAGQRPRVGEDVGVCVNPEFLREGSAIDDFEQPPFTVIGESDPPRRRRAARRLRAPAGAGPPRARRTKRRWSSTRATTSTR